MSQKDREIEKFEHEDSREVAPKKTGKPRKWTASAIAKETAALHEWMKNPKNYFLTSFLTERHLRRVHLERFAEYSAAFRVALEQAKALQEQRLVHMAITKEGDPGFIKFVLQNKAGWKDKSEISGDGQNPLAVILAKIDDKGKKTIELNDQGYKQETDLSN